MRNGKWHDDKSELPKYFAGSYPWAGTLSALKDQTTNSMDNDDYGNPVRYLLDRVNPGSTTFNAKKDGLWEWCYYINGKGETVSEAKPYECAREACKSVRKPCKTPVLAAYADCKFAMGWRKASQRTEKYMPPYEFADYAPPPPGGFLLQTGEHRNASLLQTGGHKNAVEKFVLTRDNSGAWQSACHIRGLGLGGWFVPEKFINVAGIASPDIPEWVRASMKENASGTIYHGQNVKDVCTLSQQVGRGELDRRLKEHMKTFITESDFQAIADSGVNVIRLPIGYWNVVEDPYKIYAPVDPEFSLKLMGRALKWAESNGLSVILDVHASPGSQNGWEHSGCIGEAELFKGKNARKNQKLNVEVVETLARRFKDHSSLLGIQVINEPVGYDQRELVKFYQESYQAIRKHMKNTWVIVYGEDETMLRELEKSGSYTNLVVDKHEYACLGPTRLKYDLTSRQGHEHLAKEWEGELLGMNKRFPTMQGEWGLCHGPGVETKDFVEMQLKAYKKSTIGTVFWTYKMKDQNGRWNYQTIMKYGDMFGDKCEGEPQRAKFRRVATPPKYDIGYEWEA